MRLTVGPLPPAVYWRRRAIVLGAALVVLFVAAQTCMSGSPADDRSGDRDPSPTATATSASPDTNQPAGAPASSPPATGTPSRPGGASEAPSPAPGDAPVGEFCTDQEIKLTALAAETTFAVGASVRFTIRIAHDADRPCDRDVGGGERELYLVPDPGSGRVWSSRDCADPSGEEVLRLSSGWEREHHIDFLGNGGPTCTTRLEPGNYKLRARLGTDKSKAVQITLQ